MGRFQEALSLCMEAHSILCKCVGVFILIAGLACIIGGSVLVELYKRGPEVESFNDSFHRNRYDFICSP